MNALSPVAVFFHDLLCELAMVAQAVELTHHHAPIGAALAGCGKTIGQPFYGMFQLRFIHLVNL